MRHGIPTVTSILVENESVEHWQAIGRELGYPYMLKSRTEAYEGRVNLPVKTSLDTLLASATDRTLYAEQWADFAMESIRHVC